MPVRRKSESFNLAFLDIMSCGLGAIILVFMLVKHITGTTESPDLKTDLSRLQQQEQQLAEELTALNATAHDQKASIALSRNEIAKLQSTLAASQQAVKDQNSRIEALKDSIKKAPRAQTADIIKDDRGGEEDYLLGLKVEGPRILLMIDGSASMTDEKLLDIIRRKTGSANDKKQGPKWLRTKRIARWLLARIPKNSRISVMVFNETARNIGPIKWLAQNRQTGIRKLYSDLEQIIPEGPTNLQEGLELAKSLKPSDIYLITDGLPTKGQSNYKRLNPFSSCSSLLGSSRKISGECRLKLFIQTLRESAPQNATVNVILLPLEGDPDASNAYWNWTARTGGLLFSPAENWP